MDEDEDEDDDNQQKKIEDGGRFPTTISLLSSTISLVTHI